MFWDSTITCFITSRQEKAQNLFASAVKPDAKTGSVLHEINRLSSQILGTLSLQTNLAGIITFSWGQ